MSPLIDKVVVALVVAELLFSTAVALKSDSHSSMTQTVATGLSIPLVKRASLYNESGSNQTADMQAIVRHVRQIEAKYRQGMRNYNMNTGDILLWPALNETHSRECKTDNSSHSPVKMPSPDNIPNRLDISADFPETTALPANLPVFDVSHIDGKQQRLQRLQSRQLSGNRRHKRQSSRKHVIRQKEALVDEQNDLLWAGMVSIGSTAQSFLVDMDTYVLPKEIESHL